MGDSRKDLQAFGIFRDDRHRERYAAQMAQVPGRDVWGRTIDRRGWRILLYLATARRDIGVEILEYLRYEEDSHRLVSAQAFGLLCDDAEAVAEVALALLHRQRPDRDALNAARRLVGPEVLRQALHVAITGKPAPPSPSPGGKR